jgi:hypothetical protein
MEEYGLWAEVPVGGRTLRLLYPVVIDGGMVELVRADLSGDFLYAWGRTRWGDRGPDREPRWGILIVGRRQVDGAYRAGLVHVLHRRAKLDLFEVSSGPAPTT